MLSWKFVHHNQRILCLVSAVNPDDVIVNIKESLNIINQRPWIIDYKTSIFYSNNLLLLN